VEDALALIGAILLHASKVGQRAPKKELEVKDDPVSGIVHLVALAVARAMH
jgi:hypothetical protein